jgi:predicted aspartyl protease
MEGYFDSADGNPKVTIEVKGLSGETKKIPALLDTGHSGTLSLTILQLIELGAVLKTTGPIKFGNGQEEKCLYFEVDMMIGGIWQKKLASMLGGEEAIAGLQLFSPYIATIDFKNKQIKFEEAPAEDQPEGF